MLKHIALEVIKNDIQDFYIEILGGSVSHQFTLNESDTEHIFEFRKAIKVHKLKLNNIQFELFVHESIEHDSICHICIEVPNAKELYTCAIEKDYWHRMRDTNNNKTYFIRDKNRNMFELKNKI